MAGLNTLRTRGGLFLAIVVGIALVAFLLPLPFAIQWCKS